MLDIDCVAAEAVATLCGGGACAVRQLAVVVVEEVEHVKRRFAETRHRVVVDERRRLFARAREVVTALTSCKPMQAYRKTVEID